MKSSPCDMHTYASKLKPLVVDSTDNKSKSTRCCSEKYSLRHRKRKTHVQNKKQKKLESPVCTNENSNTEYDSLFPQCALLGKKNTAAKNKPKAAPLSKYRRKTANARERTRMREINLAFENLRLCVPNAICGEEAGGANEKLTKITTLRLAMKYIDILTETLKNPTLKSDFLLHCIVEGNYHRLSNLTSEENGTIKSSIQNVGTNIEYKIYRSKNENLATKANPIANSRKTKKLKTVQKKPQSPHKKTTNSKKITQNNTNNEQKLLQNERFPLNYLLSPTLSLCSTSSSSISQSSKSFAYSPLSTSSSPLSTTGYKVEYNSKSISHPNLSNKSSGLNDPQSFLLESDGESLNLSENCFSPIEQSNNSHIAGRKGHVPFQICGNDSELPISSFGNPLELNLRLIQAKSETTDFITNIAQQPPLCISPLATLDAFSPFGDLLHGDFPEPNSLDLFLT